MSTVTLVKAAVPLREGVQGEAGLKKKANRSTHFTFSNTSKETQLWESGYTSKSQFKKIKDL